MNQSIQKFQHTKAHIGAIEMNSWMFPYVLGYRDRVPFFNGEETLLATQKAFTFLQHVQKAKGSMLLVNTNPTFGPLVKKQPHLQIYGMLTSIGLGGF